MKKPKVGRCALTIVQRYHPEVTKVIDATESLDINVTEADCRKGKGKAPSACAMAKAFMREYDGAIISTSKAYLIKGKTAVRYNVPQSVAREIVSFDRSHKFAPGNYRLASVPKNAQLGKRKWPQPPNRPAGGIKDRAHYTTGIRSL